MSSQQVLKGAGVGGEVNRINNTIFSIDTTQPIIKYKYLSLNLKSFCANFGLSFLSEIFVFSKMTIIKKSQTFGLTLLSSVLRAGISNMKCYKIDKNVIHLIYRRLYQKTNVIKLQGIALNLILEDKKRTKICFCPPVLVSLFSISK